MWDADLSSPMNSSLNSESGSFCFSGCPALPHNTTLRSWQLGWLCTWLVSSLLWYFPQAPVWMLLPPGSLPYSFPLFEPLAYTLSCYQSVVNDICVHAQLKGKAGIMLYPSPIPRAQQSLAHSRHSNYVCGVGPNDQNMGAKGSYLFWKNMKISSWYSAEWSDWYSPRPGKTLACVEAMTVCNGPRSRILHTLLCQTYKGGLHVLAEEVQKGGTTKKKVNTEISKQVALRRTKCVSLQMLA